MTTKPLNWSTKIGCLLWIIPFKKKCWKKYSLYPIFLAAYIFKLCVIDSCVLKFRRGPAQDVTYDLILWYVSKIIYLLY